MKAPVELPAPGGGGLNQLDAFEGTEAILETASKLCWSEGDATDAGDPKLGKLLNPAGDVTLCSEFDSKLSLPFLESLGD